MQGLHAKKNRVELPRNILRQKGRSLANILKDRPLNTQAVPVDCIDMSRDIINKNHLTPGPQEGNPKRATDCARAPDQNRFGHDQGPSISARVSATATSQIACISSSGR